MSSMKSSRRWATGATSLAIALLLAAPLAAAAQGLKFSGFGTLGVVSQSAPEGWGFLRSNAQGVSTEEVSATPDSRLGLRLDWQPKPNLEAALQGLIYKRPAGTPAAEALEWVYVGWRPTANSRIRLGRTSPDLFLFANSRHVGYALPWVRPPVDMYGFLPFPSVDGIEGSQQWSSGDATWLLRAAVGRVSASATPGTPGATRIKVVGKDTVVLTGQRESGGLLVKASFAQMRLSLTLPTQVGPVVDALDQLGAVPIPGLAQQVEQLRANIWSGGRVRYMSLGLQYDSGDWLTHAEINRLDVEGGSLLPATRGYVSLGYRNGDVTIYGVAGRTRSKRPAAQAPQVQGALVPVIGPVAAAQAQGALNGAAFLANGYRYDQSTISAGLRWDVAPYAALKVQVDRVRVHRNGAAMWFSDGGASGAHNTVFSLALDFVWGQ